MDRRQFIAFTERINAVVYRKDKRGFIEDKDGGLYRTNDVMIYGFCGHVMS